jgi:hypothetical protein
MASQDNYSPSLHGRQTDDLLGRETETEFVREVTS